MQISVTIEQEFVEWIDKRIEELRFSSRSHAINYALKQFIESEKE